MMMMCARWWCIGAACFAGALLLVAKQISTFACLISPRSPLQPATPPPRGRGEAIPETATATATALLPNRTWTAKANPNRTVLFMHNSKCGGSTVCALLGWRVGMTDPWGRRDVHRTNCGVQFRQPDGTWAWDHPRTCADLDAFSTDAAGALHRRRNFLAVSYPYHDAMPCPGFRSISTVRHPVARYVSLINFFGGTFDETYVARFIMNMRNGTYDREHRCAAYPPNSWTIRQLLGHARYFDPRPVDAGDLRRAIERVDMFDAFLPLEHLTHPNVLRAAGEAVPEWRQALEKSNVKANQSGRRFNFTGEFIDLLTEENKYDILLYKYVLRLYGIDEESSFLTQGN